MAQKIRVDVGNPMSAAQELIKIGAQLAQEYDGNNPITERQQDHNDPGAILLVLAEGVDASILLKQLQKLRPTMTATIVE